MRRRGHDVCTTIAGIEIREGRFVRHIPAPGRALFVRSEEALENLRREGIEDGRVHFVGNMMIDMFVALEPTFRNAGSPRRRGVRSKDFVLATLQRAQR